ncbi:unnamed protein product (macronuclear) [Paramecium tetraurelia]|uniref:Kazal-like domain-containing protein n=1 Tax=Paramecium tetraurelia TaxID=5888 RepID=A0C696_PARTE|nr:uncharacterized protein GSPATT00035442001 [Paramecium tetraurelia]CAK66313.1 unnamed protein product [Paramecium tetraurelia]|eukprot:XP_001433710.1 hypothetical protein (macronuclear) [Paramecium tetraurelia strain d4-2]
MLKNILLLTFILSTFQATDIYLEEVMDCVQNTCEPARSNCGIDTDCRLSYNNFTTCISEKSSESEYIQCRTNGYMTWVKVMDCYNDCHYFELFAVPIWLTIAAFAINI